MSTGFSPLGHLNPAGAPAEAENIAQTLARELPSPGILRTDPDRPEVMTVAVPKGFEVKELDFEKHLPAPRRAKATATLTDAASYGAYVKRHANLSTMAWCEFNPQNFALKFTSVIDEHALDAPGWREHKALFEPDMSAEWKAWKVGNRVVMGQVEFAEWLESHADDITTAEGLPTAADMLTMATNFVATQDNALKSAVRLQSGGVSLTYVCDADKGTTESMKIFEKFGIGIPVFHGCPAWQITCRLKYRIQQGKVVFFYDMVRPDTTHKAASLELIEQVRGLLGDVPMLMGSCS
jgi:uncharacterized protein YfdQ (DUF2303 family)